MGVDKALLPFGSETMLERMVRLVGEEVGEENLVVVASAQQSLPPLPAGVSIAFDEHEASGPLEGVRCGLEAREDLQVAYITGCDTPLLVPKWMDSLFSLLEGHDVVVPRQKEFSFPLSAVYHRRVVPIIELQLAAEEFALNQLFEHCNTLEVEVEQLRGVDPELLSLLNVNRPDDYQRALELAGFETERG